jgi:hypothetical protein
MAGKRAPVKNLELQPFLDFESKKLRKGQRVPKGWRLVNITATELPPNWPKNKPYPCKCGCGHTFRVGDRMAVRNVKVLGYTNQFQSW